MAWVLDFSEELSILFYTSVLKEKAFDFSFEKVRYDGIDIKIKSNPELAESLRVCLPLRITLNNQQDKCLGETVRTLLCFQVGPSPLADKVLCWSLKDLSPSPHACRLLRMTTSPI